MSASTGGLSDLNAALRGQSRRVSAEQGDGPPSTALPISAQRPPPLRHRQVHQLQGDEGGADRKHIGYEALIYNAAMQDDVAEALRLFDEMQKKAPLASPTHETLTVAIMASAREGDALKARRLLSCMLRRNERPLPPTIAEVCVACSKQRQVKAAMRTLGDMMDIGVEPSEAVIKHFMRAASTELELGLPDDKLREEMGAWAEKLRAIELPGQQQHAPSTRRAFERVTDARDGGGQIPEAASGRLYRARALLPSASSCARRVKSYASYRSQRDTFEWKSGGRQVDESDWGDLGARRRS